MVSASKFRKGDLVEVVAPRSKYLGLTGVVRSLTPSGLSARLVLEDGSRRTLRVDSLEAVILSAAIPVPPGEVSPEGLRQLAKEVSQIKEVVLRIEGWLLADSEGWLLVDD